MGIFTICVKAKKFFSKTKPGMVVCTYNTDICGRGRRIGGSPEPAYSTEHAPGQLSEVYTVSTRSPGATELDPAPKSTEYWLAEPTKGLREE